MDPKDRAARRDRIRARAVTTTVVATVVAAPVLALWAAYRGSPADEGADGPSATAREAHGPDSLDGDSASGYQNAGNASARPGGRFGKGSGSDVSVEVVSVTAGHQGAGHLEVSAGNAGDTTLVTLTATGHAPVRWSASTAASWLYLSRSSGTLAPGQSLTIKVYVDHLREPSGPWSARVAVSPAGALVSIHGYGTAPSPPSPAPSHSASPPPSDPHPTPTGSTSDPGTSAPPSSPDPDPTPSGSGSPGTPTGSTPPPTDSEDPSPTTS
jgi:hypothetical protein